MRTDVEVMQYGARPAHAGRAKFGLRGFAARRAHCRPRTPLGYLNEYDITAGFNYGALLLGYI